MTLNNVTYESMQELRLAESYDHIRIMKLNHKGDGPLFSDASSEEFIPLKLMFKESPEMKNMPYAKLLNVSILFASLFESSVVYNDYLSISINWPPRMFYFSLRITSSPSSSPKAR